jgi:putative transposase
VKEAEPDGDALNKFRNPNSGPNGGLNKNPNGSPNGSPKLVWGGMRPEFHPPHIYEDNACYFITASVVHGQRLLDTDTKRSLMRDVLKEAIKQYRIRLYAWVTLANHYHLLLKTGDTAPIYKFIKRLHGESAIRLNRLDGTPGRQVWYQYWDRFPRSERDFWSYFNYIHVNPIKHGYVRVSDGVLVVEGRQAKIVADRVLDVHQCLAQYPYSSLPLLCA